MIYNVYRIQIRFDIVNIYLLNINCLILFTSISKFFRNIFNATVTYNHNLYYTCNFDIILLILLYDIWNLII